MTEQLPALQTSLRNDILCAERNIRLTHSLSHGGVYSCVAWLMNLTMHVNEPQICYK